MAVVSSRFGVLAVHGFDFYTAEKLYKTVSYKTVMAGLDPAIHLSDGPAGETELAVHALASPAFAGAGLAVHGFDFYMAEKSYKTVSYKTVMAGLDPAIHLSDGPAGETELAVHALASPPSPGQAWRSGFSYSISTRRPSTTL